MKKESASSIHPSTTYVQPVLIGSYLTGDSSGGYWQTFFGGDRCLTNIHNYYPKSELDQQIYYPDESDCKMYGMIPVIHSHRWHIFSGGLPPTDSLYPQKGARSAELLISLDRLQTIQYNYLYSWLHVTDIFCGGLPLTDTHYPHPNIKLDQQFC